MREDILDAGVRVLRREGALRFTTPRVAVAAGISVGSLYQYFPNKQALIFAIHSRIVERAWNQVRQILEQKEWSGREKLARLARMFFLAESADVAEMGTALHEAEIYFDDQPEYRARDQQVIRAFTAFVRQVLRGAPVSQVEFSAQLIVTVLESVGKAVARRGLDQRMVIGWAESCARMLADHLGFPESVAARVPGARRRTQS
jgi:AcrR family transcriptional regulator